MIGFPASANLNITDGIKVFLREFLAIESGIDPEKSSWYSDHLDEASILYPEVLRPGRLIRDDATGLPIYSKITIREYFRSLGVLDLYVAGKGSAITDMQYRSMNPWSFVGYQFGEQLLEKRGLYIPQYKDFEIDSVIQQCPAIYDGSMPDSTWRLGRRRLLKDDRAAGRPIVATDVNTWLGSFQGMLGIHCFEDLLSPECQERLIRYTMAKDLAEILEQLMKLGWTGVELWSKQWIHAHEDDSATPVPCTTPGILAGSHLCGVDAMLELILNDKVAHDEIGTSIVSYLDRFKSFSISATEVLSAAEFVVESDVLRIFEEL